MELNTSERDTDFIKPKLLTTAINVITSPSLAFRAIKAQPVTLAPLTLILLASMSVTGWYFAVLDFDWYIDDTLSQIGDLRGAELEEARQGMQALSQRGMALIGMLGSAVSLLAIYLAQAAYLSLISALGGYDLRFRQWFSLIVWTSLPNLFLSISMAVTILLNPGGQLSNYDLNPFSLYSLGMQTGNPSLDPMLAALNLIQIWSLSLLIMAYRQWVKTALVRAAAIVIAPYLLIFGVWAYLALT